MIQILFLSMMAIAAEKPVCDGGTASRNCAFFKENAAQSEFTLKDGTSFKNPYYTDPTLAAMNLIIANNSGYSTMGNVYGNGYDPNSPAAIEMTDKFIKEQAQIHSLTEGTDLSGYEKVWLAQNIATIALAKAQKSKVMAPWPLGAKDAKLTLVPAEDIANALKAKLGKTRGTQVEKLIDLKRAPLEIEIARGQDEVRRQFRAYERNLDESIYQNERNVSKMQKRAEVVGELFKYSQDQIVSTIRRGKTDQALTEAERTLIKKVTNLKYVSPLEPTSVAAAQCANQAGNAFYSRDGAVHVCPGLMYLPNAQMVMILAHEIGHSIDPCYSMMSRWKIDKNKISVAAKACKEKCEGLNALDAAGWDNANYDLELAFNKEQLASLTADGTLKKVHTGVPISEYPFAKEFACIAKELGIVANSKNDIASTKNLIQRRKKAVGDNTPESKALDEYSAQLEKYPQCFRSSSHASQSGEAVGDMLGAVVLEKYLLEHPPEREVDKVAALGHSSERFCAREIEINKNVKLPKNGIVVLSKAAGEHPEWGLRMKSFLLNMPGTAEIFGCTRKQKACFDHLSVTKTGFKNSASTKQESGTK